MHKLPARTRSARPHRFAAKLSSGQADEIRRRYLSGETLTRLAAELDITVGALSRLVNNHTYRESIARVALKLSADNAIALARLEVRTKLPRRQLVELVFERGLDAFDRDPAGDGEGPATSAE